MTRPNPDQFFVVSQISRKQLAEELNELADECEDTPPDWPRLEPDDPRLTDELCQRYADGVSELDTIESEYARDEAESDLMGAMLGACGWHSVEPPPPQLVQQAINVRMVLQVPGNKDREQLKQELRGLLVATAGTRWTVSECAVL